MFKKTLLFLLVIIVSYSITIHPFQVEVYFSSNNQISEINKHLNQAEKSIDICLNNIDEQVVKSVLKVAGNSIKARIYINNILQNDNNKLEKLIKNEGYNKKMIKQIVKINSEKINDNFIIIDKQKVLTGVNNWIDNSQVCDSSLIIINDKNVAGKYKNRFKIYWEETDILKINKYINLGEENGENIEKDTVFVASKNSNKYHYPDCRYAQNIKEENLIKFESVKEVLSKGYKPCGVCCPPSE
ncbi:MAG: phospholipase D-like domain-containing protein [Candidatus Woesearchaeota archaeon]